MRYISLPLALVALLSAAIAPASPRAEHPVPAERAPTLLDRVYPETEFEGEGWRRLLPILLMNNEADDQLPLVRAKARAAATR